MSILHAANLRKIYWSKNNMVCDIRSCNACMLCIFLQTSVYIMCDHMTILRRHFMSASDTCDLWYENGCACNKNDLFKLTYGLHNKNCRGKNLEF